MLVYCAYVDLCHRCLNLRTQLPWENFEILFFHVGDFHLYPILPPPHYHYALLLCGKDHQPRKLSAVKMSKSRHFLYHKYSQSTVSYWYADGAKPFKHECKPHTEHISEM